MLRRVFKRIHPDLFHASPHARAVNESAMQLLNQWVGAPAAALKLSFFVRDDGSTALRRVHVDVAAGSRVKVALQAVLHACGEQLSTTAVEGEAHDDEPLELMPFLERHAADARLRLLHFSALDREEALCRHVLARERVALVMSQSWARGVDKKQRVETVARVASFVQRAREAAVALLVPGSELLLCDGAPPVVDVDGAGRLCLPVALGTDDWLHALRASDWEQRMRAGRQRTAERCAHEVEAAARLGVRLVTGECEALMDEPEYAACLDRMRGGPPARVAFPELAVMVVRGFTLLAPTGDVLYLDVNERLPHAVVSALPVAQLRRDLSVRRIMEEQEAQARVFAKRKLRLAGLLRSRTVDLPQARQATQRLSVDAGIPAHATGLYIRIDSCFGVDEDGTLAVAWNCQ